MEETPRSTWGTWVLAAGYLLVVLALVSGYGGANAAFTGSPTCDGRPMRPGDTCRISTLTRTDLDIEDRSYQEELGAAQRNAKTLPWLRGMFVGLAGTILVFVGAGRHLVVRKRRSRRHAARATIAVATVPLLAAAALLWPLEQRYAPEFREELMSADLWPFDPQLPSAPFLMIVLVLVGTAITLGVVLERHLECAVLGLGGWATEQVFSQLDGVSETEIGYAGGGTRVHPLDELADTGQTGHTRVVRVSFDPGRIPYERLLKAFWEHYDPSRAMPEGKAAGQDRPPPARLRPDPGGTLGMRELKALWAYYHPEGTTQQRSLADQYSSAIYATSHDQLVAARASKEAFARVEGAAARGISAKVAMLDRFWVARDEDKLRNRQEPDGGVILPNGFVYPLGGTASGPARADATGRRRRDRPGDAGIAGRG